MQDPKRVNVALTRGRHAVWVIGNMDVIEAGDDMHVSCAACASSHHSHNSCPLALPVLVLAACVVHTQLLQLHVAETTGHCSRQVFHVEWCSGVMLSQQLTHVRASQLHCW